MKYNVLTSDQVIAAGILTSELNESLKIKDGFAVAAYDGDVMAGVSVFSFTGENAAMSLDYIFVTEKYREQGISSDMLRTAYSLMKRSGIRDVICISAGSEDDAVPVYTYLSAQGFDAVTGYDHMLEYSIGSIADNKGFMLLMRRIPGCIKNGDEISGQALRAFGNNIAAAQGIIIRDIVYDRHLSAFYTAGERVAGCMLAVFDGVKYEIRYCYIAPDVKDAVAFPGMLAMVMNGIIEKKDQKKEVRLFIHDPDIYEAVKNVFGGAEEDMLLQKYRRELQAE